MPRDLLPIPADIDPSLKTPPKWARTCALAGLTLATLLVHGYHPFAEDGGLYVAGAEWRLAPSLFPHDRSFVIAHLSYSIFSSFVAGIVRLSHVSLSVVLLFLYAASIGATLYAARRMARRLFPSERAAVFAVGLFAAWFTLPVAGTSLLLMDPYVTARSFSTPLSLLAVSFALESRRRSYGAATVCLIVAALFHPLMAAYAAGFAVACGLGRLRARASAWAMLAALAGALAAGIQGLHGPETATSRAADVSRYYWFLSQWQWFEVAGLVGPLAVLLLMRKFGRVSDTAAVACETGLGMGLIAAVIAVVFAQERFSVHEVARLQPLRAFLLIYAVMILLLGGSVAEWLSKRQLRFAWIAAAGLAGLMGLVQRETFQGSQHLELPWRASSNPWAQAFVWAREHTATDALFAMDAGYIMAPAEDAQNFRAIAQRSVLADFSKDGGEAAITPSLAEAWFAQSLAQKDLSGLDDAQRDARLRTYGVTWLVLKSAANTQRRCPYDNGTVKVCANSLPERWEPRLP